ncbi:hypothetical protein [Enterobacter cloacae]|uniref:hypothetical protein n=1 Tax=Enterobacter cloacae TaxID=550 RepID=UPI001EE5E533|nr:hypothetical protein [Enterobacter cloacae]UKW21256.1 hypothetical protein MBA36_05560 [Enterobacter cloacae]
MKVVKFGRIFVDEDGVLNVTEFEFKENHPDEKQNPNKAEYVIPAIIDHLCNVFKVDEIRKGEDRESEMIVAGAIEKERAARMKAYLECGSCGKHSSFVLSGRSLCPHCGSGNAKRMVLGGEPPEWFKESAKDNFFTRLLGKK